MTVASVAEYIPIGAVAGALVGVGRLIVRRRRLAEAGESSWPTIAETAAQNGQPVDEQSDDAGKDPSETPAGEGDGASTGDADDEA